MLEPETPQSSTLETHQKMILTESELISEEVDYLMDKFVHIINAEREIDLDEKLYLFTWSPHPEELPDADFNTQHLFNINLLAEFLDSTRIGIACVETSQLGSPHYHGWYQLSNDALKEMTRIVCMKVMQRYAPKGLKITPSKGHIKIGSFVKAANCLYYYKKDLLQSMAAVQENPITSNSHCDINWNQHFTLFMKNNDRKSVADIENRINLGEFYKQFYRSSL